MLYVCQHYSCCFSSMAFFLPSSSSTSISAMSLRFRSSCSCDSSERILCFSCASISCVRESSLGQYHHRKKNVKGHKLTRETLICTRHICRNPCSGLAVSIPSCGRPRADCEGAAPRTASPPSCPARCPSSGPSHPDPCTNKKRICVS